MRVKLGEDFSGREVKERRRVQREEKWGELEGVCKTRVGLNRRDERGGGKPRLGQMYPGARNFRAGFFLGRRSNASCLMQWEQVRPGL